MATERAGGSSAPVAEVARMWTGNDEDDQGSWQYCRKWTASRSYIIIIIAHSGTKAGEKIEIKKREKKRQKVGSAKEVASIPCVCWMLHSAAIRFGRVKETRRSKRRILADSASHLVPPLLCRFA